MEERRPEKIHWTNEQWANAIHAKISSVIKASDSSEHLKPLAPLAGITSPDDPRFAQAIDHTLLAPDATTTQIDRLCDEAHRFNFKSCCVNGSNVRQVFERMAQTNSNCLTCCVVGFPLGASSSKSKAYEATQAIADGAREIDMVISLGALKSSNFVMVYMDIYMTVQAVYPYPVKVTIETGYLANDEKIAACYVAAEAGAAFVKTCTGFQGSETGASGGSGEATPEDVSLMTRTVAYMGGRVKVKASGGIRSFERAQEMFKAGAERVEALSWPALMSGHGLVTHGY